MYIDKIKHKVRQLKKVTVANGATKDEADTAFRIAQKLINKYSLEAEGRIIPKKQGVNPQKPERKKFTFSIVKSITNFLNKIIYFYLTAKLSSIVISAVLFLLNF